MKLSWRSPRRLLRSRHPVGKGADLGGGARVERLDHAPPVNRAAPLTAPDSFSGPSSRPTTWLKLTENASEARASCFRSMDVARQERDAARGPRAAPRQNFGRSTRERGAALGISSVRNRFANAVQETAGGPGAWTGGQLGHAGAKINRSNSRTARVGRVSLVRSLRNRNGRVIDPAAPPRRPSDLSGQRLRETGPRSRASEDQRDRHRGAIEPGRAGQDR